MNVKEMFTLAADTPVSDPRRRALEWAANEILKLKSELELLKAQTKGWC